MRSKLASPSRSAKTSNGRLPCSSCMSLAVVVAPSAVEIFALGAQKPNFSQALRKNTPSLLANVAPCSSAAQFGNAEMNEMELKPWRLRQLTASSKLMPSDGT